MLTPEIIEANKKEFIELVKSINRNGMQTDALINKLESSDFFYAPASAKYHGAYEGGLCQHSLNVYYNLRTLVNAKQIEQITEDSVKIVSLFHDISKMNLYEKTSRNVKVYSDTGSKSDELGRYEWQVELSYKKKDTPQQFLFGTHGENSNLMISYFIPLLLDESAAIINHHSNYDNPNLNITAIYNRYSLACLLHLADMLATYVDEKV